MIAFAKLRGVPFQSDQDPYIEPSHPIQKEILQAFSEMCGVLQGDVHIGIDGCSVPNFAIPLRNAAYGYARLCDPVSLSDERKNACRVIVNAMTTEPFMVGGPGSFDTALMETTQGKILSKGGAEGYQGIGIMPGVIAPGSPGLGIAFKIADGDSRGLSRSAVALDVLRQIDAITSNELEALTSFGPSFDLTNHRKVIVGKAAPIFTLNQA